MQVGTALGGDGGVYRRPCHIFRDNVGGGILEAVPAHVVYLYSDRLVEGVAVVEGILRRGTVGLAGDKVRELIHSHRRRIGDVREVVIIAEGE